MSATPVTVWESLQTQGQPVANGVPYIDPDTLQPDVDPDGLAYDIDTQETYAKKLATAMSVAGASGDVTINKSAGQVQFAIAGQTLTLTNSVIEADSLVFCSVATDDATAKSAIGVVAAAGAATIKLNAAATAITKVNFLVIRKGD
jgi:hypothetical protein